MVSALQRSAQDWMAGGGGLFDLIFSSDDASFLRRRATAKRIKAARARQKMNTFEKQAQAASVAAKAAGVATSRIVRVKNRSPDKGPAIAAARAASSSSRTMATDYTLPSSLRGQRGTPNAAPVEPARLGPAFTTRPMIDPPYDHHHHRHHQHQQAHEQHVYGNQVPGYVANNPQVPPGHNGPIYPYVHHEGHGHRPSFPQYVEPGQANPANNDRLHGPNHDQQHTDRQPPPPPPVGQNQGYNVSGQQPVPMHDRGHSEHHSIHHNVHPDHYAVHVQHRADSQPQWVHHQMPGQPDHGQSNRKWGQEPPSHQGATDRSAFYGPSPEAGHHADPYKWETRYAPYCAECERQAKQQNLSSSKQGYQPNFGSTAADTPEHEVEHKHSGGESRPAFSTGSDQQPNRNEKLEEIIKALSHLKTDFTSGAREGSSEPAANPPWTDARDRRLVDLRCHLDYEWWEIADMMHSTILYCVDRFVELVDEGIVSQPPDSGKKWEPFEDRTLRQLRDGRCNSQFAACLMRRSVKEVNDRYISMKEHDFEQTRRRGEAETRIWGQARQSNSEEPKSNRSHEANAPRKSALKNKNNNQGSSGRPDSTDDSDPPITGDTSFRDDSGNNKKQDKQQKGKQNEKAKDKGNDSKGETRRPISGSSTPSGRDSSIDDGESFRNERTYRPRRPDQYYGVHLDREEERFARLGLLDHLLQESPKNVSYDTFWRVVADRFGNATGLWPTLKELEDLADLNRREAWGEAMRLLGWIEASRTRQKFW